MFAWKQPPIWYFYFHIDSYVEKRFLTDGRHRLSSAFSKLLFLKQIKSYEIMNTNSFLDRGTTHRLLLPTDESENEVGVVSCKLRYDTI